MKYHLILLALLIGGMGLNANARSVELSHGGHHHSGGSHHAYHHHATYHYHPAYYGHSYAHFSLGNCEDRYDRCLRRHPSHPSRCRACR